MRATSTPAAVFLEVPDELKGKINVVPEMTDIITLATMYVRRRALQRRHRSAEEGARRPGGRQAELDQRWTMARPRRCRTSDWAASVNWNGSTMRVRENGHRAVRLSEGRLSAVDGQRDAAEGRAERR
jgi:spermidine/putrescine transport system substrate-binding protein